jgi:hypothetical protein
MMARLKDLPAFQKRRVRWWIEALRSGKYTQTREVLCDNAGHCCLGVACRVAIEHRLKVAVDNYSRCVAFDGMQEMLPASVEHWVGLPTPSAERLATLNDDGHSFIAIASTIETADLFEILESPRRSQS